MLFKWFVFFVLLIWVCYAEEEKSEKSEPLSEISSSHQQTLRVEFEMSPNVKSKRKGQTENKDLPEEQPQNPLNYQPKKKKKVRVQAGTRSQNRRKTVLDGLVGDKAPVARARHRDLPNAPQSALPEKAVKSKRPRRPIAKPLLPSETSSLAVKSPEKEGTPKSRPNLHESAKVGKPQTTNRLQKLRFRLNKNQSGGNANIDTLGREPQILNRAQEVEETEATTLPTTTTTPSTTTTFNPFNENGFENVENADDYTDISIYQQFPSNFAVNGYVYNAHKRIWVNGNKPN